MAQNNRLAHVKKKKAKFSKRDVLMEVKFGLSLLAVVALFSFAAGPFAGCSNNSPTPDDSDVAEESDGDETKSNDTDTDDGGSVEEDTSEKDTSDQEEPDCPELDDGCSGEIRRECNGDVLLVCERNEEGCIEGEFVDCSEASENGACRDGECVDG